MRNKCGRISWILCLCQHTRLNPKYRNIYITFPAVPNNYFFYLQRFPIHIIPNPTLNPGLLTEIKISTVIPCLYYKVNMLFDIPPVVLQSEQEYHIKTSFYVLRPIALDLSRYITHQPHAVFLLEQDSFFTHPNLATAPNAPSLLETTESQDYHATNTFSLQQTDLQEPLLYTPQHLKNPPPKLHMSATNSGMPSHSTHTTLVSPVKHITSTPKMEFQPFTYKP